MSTQPGTVAPKNVPTPGATGAHKVPLVLLRHTESPRLAGLDDEHLHLLAQTDTAFPPILVHRTTMRVLDGVHRLHAAILRGQKMVDAVFFHGPLSEGFAAAVRANVSHGLPLSLADRKAAAARLLASIPEWSDRAIAETTGLAAGTVATLRAGSAAGETAHRVGRDGRVRPTDVSLRRRMAGKFISDNPQASLRQIARACGISPSTARDVRARLSNGEDAELARSTRSGILVPGQRALPAELAATSAKGVNASVPPGDAPHELLESLQRDPSLRFSESGRALLRWLAPRVAGPRGWFQFVDRIPPHARFTLAKLARACAKEWQSLAESLDSEPTTQ